MSGASERANGRANGPVLQSVFLVVIDHSATEDFKTCHDKRPFMSKFDMIPPGENSSEIVFV